MCLQFGFVIFWQKDFSEKAAHKMLVKLTPGFDLIKLFWHEFTYPFLLARSFHINATNIAYLYKMV
jgi:hypothetical protein